MNSIRANYANFSLCDLESGVILFLYLIINLRSGISLVYLDTDISYKMLC